MFEQPNAPGASSAEQGDSYRIRLADGTEFGPLSAAEVSAILRQGNLPSTAFIRRTNGSQWRLVAELSSAQAAATNTSRAAEGGFARKPHPSTSSGADNVGAAPPPFRASASSWKAQGAMESPQAAPFFVQTSSPSKAREAKPLETALVIGGSMACLIAVLAGFWWVTQQMGLTPGQARLVGKLAIFGVPALIGGAWAAIHSYLKACRVIR